MKVKVFIDGSSGTTGLRIADRLAARPEIELLSISAEGRKDVHERAKVINSADLAFLCLPDAASKCFFHAPSSHTGLFCHIAKLQDPLCSRIIG